MFYTSHLIIDIYRGSARKTVILIHGLASCALRGKTSGTGWGTMGYTWWYGYGSIPMKIPFLGEWTSILYNPAILMWTEGVLSIGFDTLPYNQGLLFTMWWIFFEKMEYCSIVYNCYNFQWGYTGMQLHNNQLWSLGFEHGIQRRDKRRQCWLPLRLLRSGRGALLGGRAVVKLFGRWIMKNTYDTFMI